MDRGMPADQIQENKDRNPFDVLAGDLRVSGRRQIQENKDRNMTGSARGSRANVR